MMFCNTLQHTAELYNCIALRYITLFMMLDKLNDIGNKCFAVYYNLHANVDELIIIIWVNVYY